MLWKYQTDINYSFYEKEMKTVSFLISVILISFFLNFLSVHSLARIFGRIKSHKKV